MERVTAVPKLAGILPPECRKDLAALNGVVQETFRRENPAQAVSVSDFQKVLLTGACGFVGRFLLRDFLEQRPEIEVHCLVRADDAEHGRRRLREALEEAAIWDDAFESRLHVVVGDIECPRLGLSKSDFDDLCQEMDAVYHLAATLSLATSYSSVRGSNVGGLSHLLELCLSKRFKHFFYASTMGIFPAYFCTFANEFADSRIEHQMQPDLATMKRVFPVNLVGYPWSKLVGEQALLFAQTLGLPLGIFRLPLTYLSSDTGFTQPSDIKVRLASAVLDSGLTPRRDAPLDWVEPVDVVARCCLDISMNPKRSFTVYHCCNPRPSDYETGLADFGLSLREVSYTEFKQSCLARGEEHPLRHYWPLMDYFSPWWLASKRRRKEQPVCTYSLERDCPGPIRWPGILTMHVRSFRWVLENREHWPYKIVHGKLDFEHLLGRAARYADLMEVPLDLSFPQWMREGLRHLVDSINTSDNPPRDISRPSVCHQFTRFLKKNAAFAKERSLRPEIERESVEKPVFILGPSRTGTTLLHRLLARDKRFWTLKTYELMDSVLPNPSDYADVAGKDDDPRRNFAEDLFALSGAEDLLEGIHPVGIDEPEEDFGLLQASFTAWPNVFFHSIPKHGEWLEKNGSDKAYAYHRTLMKHFSWHRRQSTRHPAGAERRWLLKMPLHLMELEALLKAYPDARFIMTHREPRRFLASACSLVHHVSTLAIGEELSPAKVGAEQLKFKSKMLDRAVEFRDTHPELEDRWIDVNYTELVEDPLGIAGFLLERLHSVPMDSQTESDLDDWMFEQMRTRRSQKRHRYSLGEYGLTDDQVDKAFERYREFVTRKGIRSLRR